MLVSRHNLQHSLFTNSHTSLGMLNEAIPWYSGRRLLINNLEEMGLEGLAIKARGAIE